MTLDTADRTVLIDELKVGSLLAEGGEGRVFELPRTPHLVFKAYRQAVPHSAISDLIAWLDATPAAVARVRASAAWPQSVVVDTTNVRSPSALGVLVPRAPRRFALRHKDGTTRLATLSYLTADPAHRAAAYGLALPGPVGAERIGLVYALARLLEAFESSSTNVGHGDLSSKNVLWSLQRGPEIFVLDCDNCDIFPQGSDDGGRRRAVTPNWEDPSVPVGSNPTPASDLYSLALIFLRVVGAANFPIQTRQREDARVSVDFPIPAARLNHPLLGESAPIWALCERGLSLDQSASRPWASEWVVELERVLEGIGAGAVAETVSQRQGEIRRIVSPPQRRAEPRAPDVEVHPVRALPRPAPARPSLVLPPPPIPWRRTQQAANQPASAPSISVAASASAYVRQIVAWWVAMHRSAVEHLRGGDPRRLALCAAADLLSLLLAVFAVAMLVSPFLGI